MIKIHSCPKESEKSSLYTVKINGATALCEFARVSAMPFNMPWPGHQRALNQTEEAAFISFEGDETVKISVTASVHVQKAVVRPLPKKVNTSINGNTVEFSISEYGGYVLEINGQHNALHLFYNPPRDFKSEAEKEKLSGRTVLYYGEGIHNTGNIWLESKTTVFVESGAVIKGSFAAFGKEDIKITGYGIIDGSDEIRTTDNTCSCNLNRKALKEEYFPESYEEFVALLKEGKDLNGNLRFYRCENILCEGVILKDCSCFCVIPAACNNFVVDNLKTIGMWRYNSDGIDIFNSSNVVVKNCFLRNFDDAMVIKGIYGWDFKNNENILVENCVIWCDWGGALEIGAETNADEYKNITYKNCYLIHDSFGAMMRIHHHNRADIHNVTYENIHCEFCVDQMAPVFQKNDDEVYVDTPNTYQPYIFNMFQNSDHFYGRKNDDARGPIRDIYFKNIYLYIEDGVMPMPQICMIGISESACVKNINLENFYINGKKVEDISELNPEIEGFVSDISLK